MDNNLLLKDFLQLFETEWTNFIKSLSIQLDTDNSQPTVGDRLRPQLVFWGYILGCEYIGMEPNMVDVSSLAIPFEAVHKSSIIIDDIIDNDMLRKGKPTFHSQFGTPNAILFSILLLISAVELIQKKRIKIPNGCEMILSLIKTMCLGALNEINSSATYKSLDSTLEIIQQETVSLIQNSFSNGFEYAASNRTIVNSKIEEIGNVLGYLFQILNDSEPFFNPDYIVSHKGILNYDMNLAKGKNSIISFLYGRCSSEFLNRFEALTYDEIQNLIQKYNIKEFVLNQVETKNLYILNELDSLNLSSAKDFKGFYSSAINLAVRRALGNQISYLC